jgi:hypothetical protein
MIGTHRFIDGYWEDDVDTKRIVDMLDSLYHDCGISGFTCYGQHHAIVFYASVDEGTSPVLMTPQRLAERLRGPGRDAIVKALKKGAIGGHGNEIGAWATQYASFF